MRTPSRILFAALLFSAEVLPAQEEPAAIAVPAEFEPQLPPVADAENGIVLFVKEFGVPDTETVKRYRDSLELLKSGNPIADPLFFDEFRRTYGLGKRLLKPPLMFQVHDASQSNIVALFRLFQATEILARQSLRDGDHAASDRYLADALSWSKLLRNIEPGSLDGVVAQYGWYSSIGLYFEDWQGHNDQRRRLDELTAVLQSNRIEADELVAIAKAEARWWARHGGTHMIAQAIDSDRLLNDRFKHLTSSDLLSLPYDPEAEAKRFFNEISGQIRALRLGTPAAKWPGYSRPVVNRTLEEYRKLPNGLGDLLSEQGKNPPIDPPWIQGLCRQRLLDACLLWLKRERYGLDVAADSFKELTDPISGEPLDIDLERRVIRCRGWDDKAAALNHEKLRPGFQTEEDDYLIVVPRWKERK